MTPRRRRRCRHPSLSFLPSSSPPLLLLLALGASSAPRPPRFIGQLSEERPLPRGLLAPVWLVDSFSGSGVLFDMSFKSFKELGVSAERLGSFCKRWMARVQRSGCFFFLPPSPVPRHISLFPPSLPPTPRSVPLAELYSVVLVLSANQAQDLALLCFFLPLKIMLFLSPAEKHKRESGAIKRRSH